MFSFEGKINRLEFFLITFPSFLFTIIVFLFNFIAIYMYTFFIQLIVNDKIDVNFNIPISELENYGLIGLILSDMPEEFFVAIFVLFVISIWIITFLLIWITLAAFAKRLQDIGKSPYISMLAFIPIISQVLYIYLLTKKGNKIIKS